MVAILWIISLVTKSMELGNIISELVPRNFDRSSSGDCFSNLEQLVLRGSTLQLDKPYSLKFLGSKILTAGAQMCVSNSISTRELGRFKFLRRSVPAFLGFSRNHVEKHVSGTRG